MAEGHESSLQAPASLGRHAPFQITFRRHGDSDHLYHPGCTARAILDALERVITQGRSEALLVWPQPIGGLATFHALAALSRVPTCDTERLATLFFPWNRYSGATQKALLVDRDQLVKAALGALNRIHAQGYKHPAFGYLMAIHSLKHLSTGEQGNRRYKAVERDPSLLHPTLFELIPQADIRRSGEDSSEDHFLRRLRKHTWINQRSEYLASANDPSRTPFFLFGLHPEALTIETLRRAGLDCGRPGRRPDIILVDLTRRGRNNLGENWRAEADKFFLLLRDFYGPGCPPALAVTDDVFALQSMRWKTLKDYETSRDAAPSPKLPASAHLVINVRTDILDTEEAAPAWLENFTPEVYGTDILQFVESGLKLRRSLLEGGEREIAAAVSAAITALQNLVGLPGPVRWFREFLVQRHEGHEIQRLGERFDHVAPRGKLATALKLGSAGANHAQLSAFMQTFGRLCHASATDNPGTRFFEGRLAKLTKESGRSLVVFASEIIRNFAEWRVETENHLEYARPFLGTKTEFATVRETSQELRRAREGSVPYEHIVFIEPYPDDFLKLLAEPALPRRVMLLCHLARAKHIVDRIEALRQLDGVSPIEWNLIMVQEELQKATVTHTAEIPDLDALLLEPRLSTVDLAGPRTASSGPTRIIRTSGYVRIRAFDGTELAVYDPDALPAFSKRLARDVQPGDQICVFTPDFVDAARDSLHLSASAPEVLALYHQAVAEAAKKLPGQDLNAKADALRNRILQIDPSLASSLPGTQSLRSWINVADLLTTPRDEVRPQAPRDSGHYFVFMKALGVADDVARLYWDLGVLLTRSARISKGSAFHQVFMGILIDPYGTVSRFPEAVRQEVWRIHETAEEHLVAVLANESEGKSQ